MPKPFDATLKDLAAVDPVQFLAEADRRPTRGATPQPDGQHPLCGAAGAG
jgi:hypothetical protein